MPQYRNPFDKGDLYVKFDVQFPQNNWISPEKLVVRGTRWFAALQHAVPLHGESDPFPPTQELEDMLPSRSEPPIITADTEEVDLQDFDASQSSSSKRREAYNDSSDEEGGHHGPGVQCAHQ